ncbi:MAG TPA: alginate export family protein [Geobacteraceae bacterium]|nr:alginate export family protein [Geobacteraceae bacterium]
MKKSTTLFLSILLSAYLCGVVSAGEGHDDIPGKVPNEHWSCKEIGELAAKYGALKKLPEKEFLEKKELAESLLAVMEKVLAKCELEGRESVPAEDLERIAALHEALKDKLAQYEGYQARREAIERILAKPEVPALEYKVGVNGFLRGEGVGNFRLTNFSYAPGHGEGRFLYRVKPYAYWHPTDWLDIHAEGQGYGFSGGSHQEYNRYSLYQGFVEAKIPGRDILALKGGRQEFSYGSTFILGPDSFYDGLSFDAARLRIKPVDPLTVDLLAGAYSRPWSGGIRGYLAGGYATWTFSEGNAAETYYFHDTGAMVHSDGTYVNTWGLRGTTRVGPVTFEFEPVYESGEVYGQTSGTKRNISAYGGHFDVNVDSTMAGANNHLFFSFGYGSGDQAAVSGANPGKEFRNPNNDTSLVGDMNVIGDFSGVTVAGHHASGMQVYTLGWGIDIAKEVNFSATGHYFLANNVETGFNKSLGLETDFTLTYAMSDNLSLVAGYDRFFTGGFFRDASGSGRDVDYGYFMLQFDLSHVKPKLRPAKG